MGSLVPPVLRLCLALNGVTTPPASSVMVFHSLQSPHWPAQRLLIDPQPLQTNLFCAFAIFPQFLGISKMLTGERRPPAALVREEAKWRPCRLSLLAFLPLDELYQRSRIPSSAYSVRAAARRLE
jgi:hypothetical protein